MQYLMCVMSDIEVDVTCLFIYLQGDSKMFSQIVSFMNALVSVSCYVPCMYRDKLFIWHIRV